jgi:hypothetical protein
MLLLLAASEGTLLLTKHGAQKHITGNHGYAQLVHRGNQVSVTQTPSSE